MRYVAAAVCLSVITLSSLGNIRKQERVAELKSYLLSEKPAFNRRKQQKQNILTELDKMNSAQNRVRERIAELSTEQQELSMAMSNLKLEYDKQQENERTQRYRMYLILRTIYALKRDGALRFLLQGDSIGKVASRARLLLKVVRTHQSLGVQVLERSRRLSAAEVELSKATDRYEVLLTELKQQETLLSELLKNKHALKVRIDKKQDAYLAAARDYRKIAAQVATLFDDLEHQRDSQATRRAGTRLAQGSLALPLEGGKVLKSFGKNIHRRFKTVTYNKGIEVAADLKAPVLAVADGVVEFEGWVKGLGNVLIMHHGDGIYSLSGHLYRVLAPRGTKVKRGDSIGLVGDTGQSEIPTLYFELRKNGTAVDPMTYFASSSLIARN